jgi:hypothetical protein
MVAGGEGAGGKTGGDIGYQHGHAPTMTRPRRKITGKKSPVRNHRLKSHWLKITIRRSGWRRSA